MLCRVIDDVLAFWFGQPPTTTDEYGQQTRRWYMGGPTLDAEIREKFGPLVDRAVRGELDDWAETVRGRLALILLIDQFTRSIYRNDARMYAGDHRAQQLATEALDSGLERELRREQRNFVIMPLLHAEDLALQERAAAAMQALHDEAEPWQQPILMMGIEQSRKYRDVIARFGRFPHRNKILGRPNTPEEAAFLADWEAKQPPSGAKAL